MGWLRRTYSLEAFRRVATLSLGFLVVIVLTGATVRLTGSGLGCPDWPSCTGTRPVPQAEFHGLVEFGNRMVSGPTLALALLTWLLARRLAPARRDLRMGAGLAVLGVLLQIVMGGITVRLDLHPLAVSAHFLISIAILAAATFTVFAARAAQPLLLVEDRRLRAMAGGLVVACATIVVTGVLTTASGPHSGALPTSPVPRLQHAQLFVQLHARGVFAFTVLVVALTLWRRRSRAGARDFTLLCALVGVQIALGEYQYRNGLPWGVVLGHVTTACLIWITTCRIALAAATVRTRDPLAHRRLADAQPRALRRESDSDREPALR